MGKAPEKKCADCGKTVHVRKRECSCGFVFPYKERKKKEKVIEDYDPHDIEHTYDNWKKVPPRSRGLTCGTCRKKLKGGMLGWHSAYADGDKYWWCENCFKDFKDDKYYSLIDKGVQEG